MADSEIIPLQNVSQVRDELPQPYRMIDKILQQHILDVAWDRISAKFPLSQKPPGIGEERPNAKLIAPQTLYAASMHEGHLPQDVSHIVPSNCPQAPLLLTAKGDKRLYLLGSSSPRVDGAGSSAAAFDKLKEVPLFSSASYEPFDLGGIDSVTEGCLFCGEDGDFVIVAASAQTNEPTQASLSARDAHAETAAAYAEARAAAIAADPDGGATAEIDVEDPGEAPPLEVLHRSAVELVAIPVPKDKTSSRERSGNASASLEYASFDDGATAAAAAAAAAASTTTTTSSSMNDDQIETKESPESSPSAGTAEPDSVQQPRVLIRWMAPQDQVVTSLSMAPSASWISIGMADGTVHLFRAPTAQLQGGPAGAAAAAEAAEKAEKAAAADAAASAEAAAASSKKGKKKPALKKGKGNATAEPIEEVRLVSLASTQDPSVSVSAAVHAVASSQLFGEALVPIVKFLEEGPAPTPDDVRARQGGGATIMTAPQLARLATPGSGGIKFPDRVQAVAFIGWEDKVEFLRVELCDGATAEQSHAASIWNVVLPGGLRVLTLNTPVGHMLAAGLADGSTIVYSTAVPMTALCYCSRKHAHAVIDLAFSIPPTAAAAVRGAQGAIGAASDGAGPGSYLVSTSAQGGVIVYRLPDDRGVDTESCVRAMEADGTATPYVASVHGLPAALVGDDAPAVQLLDLTDGRPVANLLPSREDSRSLGMETPIHVCLTSEHAFMVLPKRRLLAAFAVDEVIAGVLSREDRSLYGHGDENGPRDIFLRSRIGRVADETPILLLPEATSKMNSAETSSGLALSSAGRAAGSTRASRRGAQSPSQPGSPSAHGGATRRTSSINRKSLPLNSGFLRWRKPLETTPWIQKAWPTKASTAVAPVLDPASDVCLMARFDEWRSLRKDQRAEHNAQQIESLLGQL